MRQLNRIAVLGENATMAGTSERDRAYARFRRASDAARSYVNRITSMPSYNRAYFGGARRNEADAVAAANRAGNIQYSRSTYMGLNNG